MGHAYNPRRSTQGDLIAAELYEDLFTVAKGRLAGSKYETRVAVGSHVLNPKNRTLGVTVRRGDGTYGEIVPGHVPALSPGFSLMRADNAFVEIGCEVKILATAQQRQARRVENDLRDQVDHFNHRKGSRDPLAVGIVGINYAANFCSRVGTHETRTDGRGARRHPVQEAAAATLIVNGAAPSYDEFLVIEYNATNEPPYPFTFVNQHALDHRYGILLARLAGEYEARF